MLWSNLMYVSITARFCSTLYMDSPAPFAVQDFRRGPYREAWAVFPPRALNGSTLPFDIDAEVGDDGTVDREKGGEEPELVEP